MVENKKNKYMTLNEIANIISMTYMTNSYRGSTADLKKISEDPNFKRGNNLDNRLMNELEYATENNYWGEERKDYYEMMKQIIDALKNNTTAESKDFLNNFRFINSAFVDKNSAKILLNRIDLITDETIKLQLLRALSNVNSYKSTSVEQQAAMMAVQSPKAQLVDFLKMVYAISTDKREQALQDLEIKTLEYIETELNEKAPNMNRIQWYISNLYDAAEKTYENSGQKGKIHSLKERINLEKFLSPQKGLEYIQQYPQQDKEKIKELEKELQELKRQLAKKDKTIQMLSAELESTQKENQKLSERLSEVKKENTENKKKVKMFADAASEIKFNMFGSRGVKEIQELAKQVRNEK